MTKAPPHKIPLTNNMNPSSDIIIFGGSFDPPHQGHLDCIELASMHLPEAQIWVLPAGQVANAKDAEAKTADHSFEERFSLCQQAFAASKISNKIVISDYEKKLASKLETDRVYSLQTINSIHKDHPKSKLHFLIGQDQLSSFAQWYKPLEILQLASLIVIERPGNNQNEVDLRKTLDNLAQQMNIKIKSSTSHNFQIDGSKGTITLLANKNPAASSTIKKLLSADQPIPSGWLDTQIQKKLSNHQLYRTRKQP